jgi:bacterioferritin-associated ferredoxin
MKDTDFFICLAPDCEVVYFSHDVVFRQEDVVVPVAFKTGASPKFVCYCNRVTEEEIIRAVVNGEAKTIGDIARLTDAMKNGKCLTNNPKGVCCHKDIETVIRLIESSKQ